MSDNKNDKKRRPLKNIPPERFQPKVLLIWLSIVAAVLALFWLNPGRPTSPAFLKIQQVMDYADKGEVAEGEIRAEPANGRDWVIISGVMKEPILTSESGKTKAFHAAGRLTDLNMERLQKSAAFIANSAMPVGVR